MRYYGFETVKRQAENRMKWAKKHIRNLLASADKYKKKNIFTSLNFTLGLCYELYACVQKTGSV